MSVAGAGRDPAAFTDPDRFDVRRGNTAQNLAFARGPHFCLGVHLARLEARAALAAALSQLPGLRLDPARPAAPRGLVFRKPPSLPVRWDTVRPGGSGRLANASRTGVSGGSGPMSSAISRGLVGMETLLPVGDVELCVDTVGSPTDIPLLLIGTTVATWHASSSSGSPAGSSSATTCGTPADRPP